MYMYFNVNLDVPSPVSLVVVFPRHFLGEC